MRYPRRSDSVTGKIRSDTMPDLADLAFLDATVQAELVQKKEVKPIELVEAARPWAYRRPPVSA